jgi:hypothetical protein
MEPLKLFVQALKPLFFPALDQSEGRSKREAGAVEKSDT